MDHAEARRALQAQADLQLDESSRAALARHLESCVECRQAAANLESLEEALAHSLQARWPAQPLPEAEAALLARQIQIKTRRKPMSNRISGPARGIAWAAALVLFVLALGWGIRNLLPAASGDATPTPTPLPAPGPAVDKVTLPTPTPIDTPALPQATPTPIPVEPGGFSLYPNLHFVFATALPEAPGQATVYTQRFSDALTAKNARQAAARLGVNGNVYTSPGEGPDQVIMEVSDGTGLVRFLNFNGQFIYMVDYSKGLFDHGVLPPFEIQAAVAEAFLKERGLLNFPYQVEPSPRTRGGVHFVPLLDDHPVLFGIGINPGNMEWIDVVVNSAGEVSQVMYSQHDFQPAGAYPILPAQAAWARLAADNADQRLRYAVVSEPHPVSRQGWQREYPVGQRVDLYGYTEVKRPVEVDKPPLVFFANQFVSNAPAGLAENTVGEFLHAWGKFETTLSGGQSFNLAGWEKTKLADEILSGVVRRQGEQAFLEAEGKQLALPALPAEIANGAQADIRGVTIQGNQPTFEWSSIETHDAQDTSGGFWLEMSCMGGGGGGGGEQANANFGGGGFAFLKNSLSAAATPTPLPGPYQVGTPVDGLAGIPFLVTHKYAGGRTTLEASFITVKPDMLPDGNGFTLDGPRLADLERYHNQPVRIWGQVTGMQMGSPVITLDRFEPVYPDLEFKTWTGTEELVTLGGKEVVLFTSSTGEKMVTRSSLAWPQAQDSLAGRPGDLIGIEGYLFPDQQVGGYPLVNDLSSGTELGPEATSSQPPVIDHTQLGEVDPLQITGTVTINRVELAYASISFERCTNTISQDPALGPWLEVQPLWVFSGQFEDGRIFVVQVQALPDEYFP